MEYPESGVGILLPASGEKVADRPDEGQAEPEQAPHGMEFMARKPGLATIDESIHIQSVKASIYPSPAFGTLSPQAERGSSCYESVAVHLLAGSMKPTRFPVLRHYRYLRSTRLRPASKV